MAIVMCVKKDSETALKSEAPVVQCTSYADQVHATVYTGKVFATRERNGYDDSDFYAIVWNGERMTSFEYATTRYGGTDHNNAAADATPEMKAEADAWGRIEARKLARSEAVAKATEPDKGKTVVVKRGRKVAKGTEGIVFWVGMTPGYTRWASPTRRIGFKTAEGESFFTAATNVDVIDPEMYLPGSEELDEVASHATGLGMYGHSLAVAYQGSGYVYV